MARNHEKRRTKTHVVVGTTLAGREDGVVDALLNVRLLVLAEEDETGARAAEGLVAAERANSVSAMWSYSKGEKSWLTWWW